MDEHDEFAIGAAFLEELELAVDFIGGGDFATGGVDFEEDGRDVVILPGGAGVAVAFLGGVDGA